MNKQKKRWILLTILLVEILLSAIFYKVARANGYCNESNYLSSISAELKDSCIMSAMQSMPGYWFYIGIDVLIVGLLAGMIFLWKSGERKSNI